MAVQVDGRTVRIRYDNNVVPLIESCHRRWGAVNVEAALKDSRKSIVHEADAKACTRGVRIAVGSDLSDSGWRVKGLFVPEVHRAARATRRESRSRKCHTAGAVELEGLTLAIHTGAKSDIALDSSIVIPHSVIEVAFGAIPAHRSRQRAVAGDVDAVRGVAGYGVAEQRVDGSGVHGYAVLRVAQRSGSRGVGTDQIALQHVAGGIAVELDAAGVAGCQLAAAAGVVNCLDLARGQGTVIGGDIVHQAIEFSAVPQGTGDSAHVKLRAGRRVDRC